MCGQCEALSERENFASLSEFYERVRQLDVFVQRGVLSVVREQEVWPEMVSQAHGNEIRQYLGDVIVFTFECPLCCSQFELSANFYHGGAAWRVGKDRAVVIQ